MTVALVDSILIIETEYLCTVFTERFFFSNLDVQRNVLTFGFITFQCATFSSCN